MFLRYSIKGAVINETETRAEVTFTSMPYNLYMDQLIYDTEPQPCLPPYNITLKNIKTVSPRQACPDYDAYLNYFESEDNFPEVIKCKIGIAPFGCPSLKSH